MVTGFGSTVGLLQEKRTHNCCCGIVSSALASADAQKRLASPFTKAEPAFQDEAWKIFLCQ